MRDLRSILEGTARGRARPDRRGQVHREELVVVAAFAAVVACFAATTTYSEAIASALTQRSCALPDRALPCVVELDRMRSELGDVARLVEKEERGGGSEVTALIGAEFERIEKSGESYATLVGDGSWAPVRDAIRAVQASARGISHRLGERQSLEAAPADFEDQLRSADLALEAAVSRHRARLEQEADAFGVAEGQVGRTTLALQTASLFIAALVVASTVGMLRRRRHQVESHIDELGQFAARVAHDLRSPLMPPMLALDRVRARMRPDDPLAGNVERGARSLKTIERLVEGLLAFASSGTSTPDGAATSICETLESVVAEYTDVASASGIALDIECPSEANVRCSAGTFVSIISNLVGNAIKYMGDSPERRVCVRVRVGALARLEVVDTGPGIPAGSEHRIFEPYVRGQTGVFGIGLGLATVKRLVLAHGGTLGVFRNERRGSTFWVELPLAVEVREPARALRPSVSS